MKRIAITIALLTLALSLLLMQAACAEPNDAVKAVYDALVKEGSKYSQFKAMYRDYYPDIKYTETLEDAGFTLAISGSEYMDGSWTFDADGDALVAEMGGEDLSGSMMIGYVLDAVADAYGMDAHLVNSYVLGLNAHGLTSDDYSMTVDEAGNMTCRIRITGPWAMPELDQMALDEAVLYYDPLTEDDVSMATSCGKLMMVANGTAGDVKILIGEYGGLDALAYQSIVNVVNTLKPNGYEDFIAEYTELTDAEGAGYAVSMNVDQDTVGEIIDDASPDYSYAVIRFGADADAEPAEAQFSQWNEDAPALKALTEYVEAVTDEESPDYIPPVDRIATFDMDGTLIGELAPTYLEVMLLEDRILRDESYQPDAEMLEFGRMIREHALDKSFPADFDYEFSYHQARAFAGMTLNEYADFITRFLVHEADGFEGMTYAEAYYLPMAEVVEYLQDNGFKCYVVSGSDRFIVRTFIEGILDIPYENIIGSDVALEAKDQGDTDGIEYVFKGDDTLVRTDKLLIKNLKTNKVVQIAQEIGRQPVLSFGNSSGDVSMNNFALCNNRYRSAVFQLIADDDVRDYGSSEKGPQLREQWEGMGYNVISMRDDWKTIYGEDVIKTGEFHWLEDYAEDRVPADAEAAEPSEAVEDVQYVLFLGTNDKDTNQPVFTQAEAKERAKEILVRHFGGYTLQEADGGWVGDDGTLYQEYTLVIYLSDTTSDVVHAAADELLRTFNQTSVLIQSDLTGTEFYGGAA